MALVVLTLVVVIIGIGALPSAPVPQVEARVGREICWAQGCNYFQDVGYDNLAETHL